MDARDELRTGHVSLKSLRDLFNQRLPFLGHIKLNTIQILDHLGDIILVPDMFCSTPKVSLCCPHSGQLTQLNELGFSLYHRRLLQKSPWKPLHRARRL
jgi:hypothetical protein